MFAPLRKLFKSTKECVVELYYSIPFLILLNLFLFLTSVREYRLKRYKIEHNQRFAFPSDEPNVAFIDDVYYALEAIDYVQRQKLGKLPHETQDFTAISDVCNKCTWNVLLNSAPSLDPDFIVEDQWTEIVGKRGFLAYIFGAYWDTRPNPLFPESHAVVQILAMVRRGINASDPFQLHCQVWSAQHRFIESSLAYPREIWRTGWDPRQRFYEPVLFSCPIRTHYSAQSIPPKYVNIAWNPCEQTQMPIIAIHPNTPPKMPQPEDSIPLPRILVCVKGVDFLTDQSDRLIEWIELQKILGAQKIVIYTYYVHPETDKVLQYYSKHDIVEQVRLTLPGSVPEDPYIRSKYIWRNRQQKRRNELIPYNDCVYRHLNSHDYILIVDTDEVMMPQKGNSTWPFLLHSYKAHMPEHQRDKITAFSVRNAFFFDNLTKTFDPLIPENMHILRHNVRAKSISSRGNYGKSFMSIANMATAFNHYPLHKQYPDLLPTSYMPVEDIMKLHYKSTCPVESRDECPSLYSNIVLDSSFTNYKDKLIEAFRNTTTNISGRRI